jgi:DNA polymerase-3 subunit delta'
MHFNNIPFKNREKQKLISQINEGKVPHAQLFIGREGSGNLALALAYVSYLFCENKQENDSCGECKNCKLTHKYVHPDFHFSFPVVSIENKKREDTTSEDFLVKWRETIAAHPFLTIHDWQQIMESTAKPNINTKECNDIITKLSYNSFLDGKKILLIWLPEYLGNEGNKLLKMIEEPFPDTYIILVANDRDKILNTILSRCQEVKILPFLEEEIKSYLVEEKNLDINLAMQYAKLSQGNISKALELVKGEEQNLSSLLFDWLRICYKSDAEEMQAFTDQVASWPLDSIMQFFDYSLHFFEAYHAWYISGNEKPNLTDVEAAVAEKMKKIIDQSKIEDITKCINNLMFYLMRNGNKKINIFAECITIGDILKNKPKTLLNKVIFANESLLVQ